MTRNVYSDEFVTPLPRPIPLIPQTEMVRRIEAARLEDAPPKCRACGSTTPNRPVQKWCPSCEEHIAITLFARNRSNADGRQWECRSCQVKRKRRDIVRNVRRAS